MLLNYTANGLLSSVLGKHTGLDKRVNMDEQTG